MNPDDSHRVLFMVSALHERGYELLRIAPGLSPSGCYWRCAVTYSANLSGANGAEIVDWSDSLVAAHSTGFEACLFRWTDAAHMSVPELATEFIERFPEIALRARGRDPEYVGWYQRMLDAVAEQRLPVAFDDWNSYDDGWITTDSSEPMIPCPPGSSVSLATSSPERQFCDAAYEYLLSFSDLGVTPEVLARYLEPGERLRAQDLNGVYLQLLFSAQNANMRTAVITGSLPGGMKDLSTALSNFDPGAVRSRHGGDWEALLNDIVATARPRGKIRTTPRSIWPQFCRSALSGAEFLSEFQSVAEFYAWADAFAVAGRDPAELPSEVGKRVTGLGFALSCDFLKELGVADYPKPDVHIKAILVGLGVAPQRATDIEIFRATISFAQAADRSAYYVDKLMWLVGSGWFYWHDDIQKIQTDRDALVARMRPLFAGLPNNGIDTDRPRQ